MDVIRCGVMSTPPLAIPAATMAFCSAVVCTLYWPMELWPRCDGEFGASGGKIEGDVPGRSIPGTEL